MRKTRPDQCPDDGPGDESVVQLNLSPVFLKSLVTDIGPDHDRNKKVEPFVEVYLIESQVEMNWKHKKTGTS